MNALLSKLHITALLQEDYYDLQDYEDTGCIASLIAALMLIQGPLTLSVAFYSKLP